ncbi:NAD(P)-binding protein [Epithele typhae]|uniref:NAD(P)-binding protein n=1 Tax=Epithele typhae TaxID=378194 RepID=UPI00200789BA|nr:NAD(P)-binding protein [Epithele typhae]KAH9913548.1 NAD(P)-binding protein [Epithele typhae]
MGLLDYASDQAAKLLILKHTFLGPKPEWTADNIPDLSGRVMVVTGGNAGIGAEIVKELLKHNAKVYMLARNADKARAVVAALKEETGGKEALFVPLDLADFASEEAVHVLFNNAGLFGQGERTTPAGHDLMFATNAMGPHLLTTLLLPALERGAAASADGRARVVALGSATAYFGRLRFDALAAGPARDALGTDALYAQSKLADVLLAFEGARRYRARNVVCVALHPGIVRTELMINAEGFENQMMVGFARARTPDSSATSAHAPPWTAPAPAAGSAGCAYAALCGNLADPDELNGKWLVPWAREVPFPNKLGNDEELAKQLWDWVEKELESQ